MEYKDEYKNDGRSHLFSSTMTTEESVFPDELYLEMFLVFEVLSSNVAEVWGKHDKLDTQTVHGEFCCKTSKLLEYLELTLLFLI